MIRLHVERAKTLLMLFLTVVTAVVVGQSHQYRSVWLPLLLAALTAFFGWRARLLGGDARR